MTWVRNGSTTLTQFGDDLDVTGLTAKEFNQVMKHVIARGTKNAFQTFNDDSASVYARRTSTNGAADGTSVSRANWDMYDGDDAHEEFSIQSICSISGEEKLGIIRVVSGNTAGAGNVPNRIESVGKFVPSPDADITSIETFNTQSGDFDVNSNLSVLGAGEEVNNGIGTQVGGWVEVGRTKLTSNSETIRVGNLPNKRYYMVLTNPIQDGTNTIGVETRFNDDGGSNYAGRRSTDGASDTTHTSQTNILGLSFGTTVPHSFVVDYISNLEDKEKLMISHHVVSGVEGAGTEPNRSEIVGKWANTTDEITSITKQEGGSGYYASGSEMIVLGYDESDTHSDNFWEEIGYTELTNDNQVIEVTFPAKKYLWVQFWGTDPSGDSEMTFNSDTGSNYARRISANGGTDSTVINDTDHTNIMTGGTNDLETFTNLFIINNKSQEKLAIGHTIHHTTAGAGTAPFRVENVSKWANTTEQITKIRVEDTGTGFDTGTRIIVWGHD